MATLKGAIKFTDAIKPNAFTNEQKTQWINEVEGMVQTQVLLIKSPDIITYTWEPDEDPELLANPPHDDIYYKYLIAMIDFFNGEYDKYANTVEMFNAAFSEFSRWIAINYRPADYPEVPPNV